MGLPGKRSAPERGSLRLPPGHRRPRWSPAPRSAPVHRSPARSPTSNRKPRPPPAQHSHDRPARGRRALCGPLGRACSPQRRAVLGNAERGALASAVVGSVAARRVNHAGCPVVLVPTRTRPDPTRPRRTRRERIDVRRQARTSGRITIQGGSRSTQARPIAATTARTARNDPDPVRLPRVHPTADNDHEQAANHERSARCDPLVLCRTPRSRPARPSE